MQMTWTIIFNYNFAKICNICKNQFPEINLINLSFMSSHVYSEINKIKIGLLVPLTGDNAELGKQILNSVRLAIKDINSTDSIPCHCTLLRVGTLDSSCSKLYFDIYNCMLYMSID